MAVYKVVMIRHGESEWNKENKFCGWFDADLSELGINEAKTAGQVSTATASHSHRHSLAPGPGTVTGTATPTAQSLIHSHTHSDTD